MGETDWKVESSIAGLVRLIPCQDLYGEVVNMAYLSMDRDPRLKVQGVPVSMDQYGV